MSGEKEEFAGQPLEAAAAPGAGRVRYDLEELRALAERDRACDETVRVRVTQDDIRKLMSRRRAKGAE